MWMRRENNPDPFDGTRSTSNFASGVLTRDDCIIEFGPDHTVFKFGQIGHGQFDAIPDIAGLGVFIAFNVLSWWSLVIVVAKGLMWWLYAAKCCIFLRRKRLMNPILEKLDETISLVGDAQLFLICAYTVSLNSPQSQTPISLYHSYISLYNIMIGLFGVTLSFLVFSNHKMKNFFSTLIRLALFWLCLAHFAISLNSGLVGGGVVGERDPGQNGTQQDQDPWNPPPLLPWVVDSTLLLPAPCIHDPSLGMLSNLTEPQQAYVSRNFEPLDLRLTGAFAMMCAVPASMYELVSLAGLFVRPDDMSGFTRQCVKGLFSSVWWKGLNIVMIGLSLTFMGLATYRVQLLRSWLDQSVWLKRPGGVNPEQDVRNIGQLAPLMALMAIPLAIGNILSFVIGRTWKSILCRYYPLDEDKADSGGVKWNEHGSNSGPECRKSEAWTSDTESQSGDSVKSFQRVEVDGYQPEASMSVEPT